MSWLLLWSVILIGAVVLELYGVWRQEKGDTITETVRTWISLIPFAWGRWLAKIVLTGVASWLVLHIWELA